MTNGAWDIEVHDPSKGHASILSHHEGLTGAEAVEIMEKDLDKAFRLRERGKATAADHEALRVFQVKTGKRLLRDYP
jgi:hypothetical protein